MDFQNVINDNGNENENNIRKQRSTLSLEGGKIPFSLYTRRIIKAEKIPELLNDESTKGLCGTINFGSSCYMNSVLTSLNNCQELVYYFLKGDYKKDLNTLEPKIVEAFGDLVEEYWVKQTEAVLPEKFKDSIEEKLPHFNGYKQQDANEFLITTLNLLNEGLKNEVFNENNEQVHVELDKSDEENSKKFWNFNLKYNDSIITDLFCGQLKQTIKCPECHESKIKFECFNILNLPIAKNENKYIYKFHFYYVPKYGIRRTVKIYYNKYKNDATFAELFENLKNEEKFLSICCVVKGCPAGLGEPVFGKLHAALASAMMSINAAKGFEYGEGFGGMDMRGSEQNDIFYDNDGTISTKTNHSGGIQGGISNGQDIYFRVAFKPVATLLTEQPTVNVKGEDAVVKARGRHDPCVLPRAVPIVEAMTAMTILDYYLLNKTTKL